ncbi:MAG: glycosyltransferase, partial [Limisphaerales bacterium]
MKILSVIIPALNEERYLGDTLAGVAAAIEDLHQPFPEVSVEVIVVDNDSTDATADIASQGGAKVVPEPIRNISRARNAGAEEASGDVFLFLDADTLIPPGLFARVVTALNDPSCVGGAFQTDHRPRLRFLRFYCWCWRMASRINVLAQGACQFYRREAFETAGGYDEEIFMGEDVEFYWTVGRQALSAGKKLSYITDLEVVP